MRCGFWIGWSDFEKQKGKLFPISRNWLALRGVSPGSAGPQLLKHQKIDNKDMVNTELLKEGMPEGLESQNVFTMASGLLEAKGGYLDGK